MQSIHLSQALKILNRGRPVNITVVKKNGELMECRDVVSLRYDYYAGTRTIKFLASQQCRTIHDVCIIRLDDFDVFL